MTLPLRGESGRFLSIRGLSGPGSAGADAWAAECLTAKSENGTGHDTARVGDDGTPELADAGSVNVLKLLVLAGFALAVAVSYAQHPRMVQLGVGLVVTVVTVALAWVVAVRFSDNRPVRSRGFGGGHRRGRRPAPRGFVPSRPSRRAGGPSRAAWESSPAERVSWATDEELDAVSWTSLPSSSLPAAVVLWETFKGTRRRRLLRRASSGKVSAPLPRRVGRAGREGRRGGRR